MAAKRIIPCLLVKDGRVVRPDLFQNYRDMGHPAEAACRLELVGADEIFFLETGPPTGNRRVRGEWVREVAHALSIPFAVGGEFLATGEVRDVLGAGADKAIMALGGDPWLVTDAALRFDRCRIVLSAELQPGPGGAWRTPLREGESEPRSLEDLLELGAGELLFRQVDPAGGRCDLGLIQQAVRLPVPVIAAFDAEDADGIRDALENGADAVLLTGSLVGQDALLATLKGTLAAGGLAIRS
jgi:imidazole glycerol-phosphate synthase subunit HisF